MFPKQYASFIEFKKQGVSEFGRKKLIEILISAVDEGSSEVSQIIND
jgi:hypothetical protein